MPRGSIARSALASLAARVSVGVFGLLQAALLARFFGASATTDAYLVALWVPLFVSALGDTVLVYSLVPHLVSVKVRQGSEAATRAAGAVCTGFLLLLLALVAVLFVSAPLVVRVLAPGFSAQTQALAGALVRGLTPAVFLGGVAGMIASLLYAQRRVAVASFAAALPIAGAAAFLLIGEEAWGVRAPVFGYSLGALVQLAVLLPALRRCALRPAFPTWDAGELRRVLHLVVPRLGGVALNRAVTATDRLFASLFGAGGVSLLAYSYAIALIPVSLAVSAAGKTLMPRMAHLAALGRIDRLKEMISRGVGFALFFLAPAVFLLIAYRTELIRLLFERAAFGANDTAVAASLLACYSPAILFQSIAVLLSGVFFALGDTRTPLKVTAMSFVANAVLDFILLKTVGLLGIAIATLAVGALSMSLLSRLLVRRLGRIDLRGVRRSVVRLAGAMAVMVLGVGLVDRLLGAGSLGSGTIAEAARIACCGGTGLVLFLLASRALRLEEYRTMEALVAGSFLVAWMRTRSPHADRSPRPEAGFPGLTDDHAHSP